MEDIAYLPGNDVLNINGEVYKDLHQEKGGGAPSRENIYYVRREYKFCWKQQ